MCDQRGGGHRPETGFQNDRDEVHGDRPGWVPTLVARQAGTAPRPSLRSGLPPPGQRLLEDPECTAGSASLPSGAASSWMEAAGRHAADRHRGGNGHETDLDSRSPGTPRVRTLCVADCGPAKRSPGPPVAGNNPTAILGIQVRQFQRVRYGCGDPCRCTPSSDVSREVRPNSSDEAATSRRSPQDRAGCHFQKNHLNRIVPATTEWTPVVIPGWPTWQRAS